MHENSCKVTKNKIFFITCLGVFIYICCPQMKSVAIELNDDDYLNFDKKMELNKRTTKTETKKPFFVVDNYTVDENEKKLLKDSISENELIREKALRELKKIENKKVTLENKKKELEKSIALKQKNKTIENVNNKAKDKVQVLKTQEKSDQERKILIEKEKFKLKEIEVQEYNKKIKEQEEKLAKQQKIILEQENIIKQKQLQEEAIKELKIQKEKEKQLKQELALKDKKLQEQKKLEDALKNNNEEIKKLIAQNNVELKQELEKQQKEKNEILDKINILNDYYKKNNELKDNLINNNNKSNTVKSSNYSNSAFIISKIEQNLTYNTNKNTNNNNLEIKKGSWNDDKSLKIEDSKIQVKKINTETKNESLLTEKAREAKTFKDRGYKAVQEGAHEVGIKFYKKALDLDKDDGFAKLSLATTYHLIGQYRQAKPLYTELLEVFPKSEKLVSNLLSIMIQESPYEAVYLIPNIAYKHDNSALIQAQTGIAFANIKQYNEAIKYMKKALYLEPDNIDFKYNLALFYDLIKNYPEAKSLYNDIVNTDNNSHRVDGIRKRLEKL